MIIKRIHKLISGFFERIIIISPVFSRTVYIDHPFIGKINDYRIYRIIADHSRWIDRINPIKMMCMALKIRYLLENDYKSFEAINLLEDYTWKFYGKKSRFKHI